MRDLKYTTSKGISLVLVAVFVLRAMTALAQSATENCRPASVIPLTNKEPPARIVVDPPLAEPLASGGGSEYPILCSEPVSRAGVRPKCSGALAARRTHSCQGR
ncbi:MAG: DUF6130 family protein [Betaproteobacteria bacterium]